MRVLASLAVVLGASADVHPPTIPRAPERIVANDNRAPAGVLRHGVLELSIEVREGTWYPDGDDKPGIAVQAFGEPGKPLFVPGPLIRVAAGTEVRLTVANRLTGPTLRIYDLYARPEPDSMARAPISVAAGASQQVRFRLDAPGTYYYWATTTGATMRRRSHEDSQLTGAIVVDDPRTAPRTSDRIFLLSELADSLAPNGAPVPGALLVTAINGRSWPYTERLRHMVGDSVRWRVINPTSAAHPMHLHGFYYRIDSRGDNRVDTLYDAAAQQYVVTDRVAMGATMSMTWVPERAGNWLFHCHVPIHLAPHLPLDRSGEPESSGGPTMHAMSNHAMEGMAGLVLGIEVSGGQRAAAPVKEMPARRLRLVARVESGSTIAQPAYGFVLDDGTSMGQRSRLIPGPVLVLERGKPVAITVVNELPEPTAVHWHGIELESYYDGVAGFGGATGRIAPVIAPRDSFVARFTPPRAGTFMYHTHIDELRQEAAGLSGIIVVHEPNEAFDSATDHPLLLSTSRKFEERLTLVYVNGTATPPPLELRAGVRHRLRLANIMMAPPAGAIATLLRDSTIVSWRPLLKDAMVVPARQASMRPAPARITIGETHDFEFTPEPGEYRLEFRLFIDPKVLLATQRIVAR